MDNTKEDENSGGNLYYPTNRFRALIENYLMNIKEDLRRFIERREGRCHRLTESG